MATAVSVDIHGARLEGFPAPAFSRSNDLDLLHLAVSVALLLTELGQENNARKGEQQSRPVHQQDSPRPQRKK